eukprot:c18639_g1_i1.p1 GENE.c18639_g1_i1~~c18639_g1_i1.p1  ORF type:complete len:762 (-),score=158.08 c18639_g1_i1:96-2345(-)
MSIPARPGRKKIMIQPFKTHVEDPGKFVTEKWGIIRTAIEEIHKKNAGILSFEELYRYAYSIVLAKRGDELYDGLESVMREHLQQVAKELVSTNDHDLLTALCVKWADHQTSTPMICDILMYMDRTYIPRARRVPISTLCMQIFRDEVVRHPSIRPRLIHSLLSLVAAERVGEVINKLMFRSVTQMLVNLGWSVYTDDFETHFLRQSADFYKYEAQKYISSSTCSDYLRMVNDRLGEEEARVEQYLDKSTLDKIRATVERELVQTHLDTLIEMDTGVNYMLTNALIDDLTLMYRIFSRLKQGMLRLSEMMRDLVHTEGLAIVNDPEKNSDASLFVGSLLKLRAKYQRVIETSFASDKIFLQALSSAFEKFVNVPTAPAPELLSLFINDCLRRGFKDKSEEEVESTLDQVMVLFRCLQDKDLFEQYCKLHLSRRLLSSPDADENDNERSFIQKLKVECGTQFTSKLEGMLRDMQLSRESTAQYRSNVRNMPQKPNFDLYVHTLTMGTWPVEHVVCATLPPQLKLACDTFAEVYLGKHSGRKLTWHTSLGSAELEGNFARRGDDSSSQPGLGQQTYVLCVNTHQMLVLLLFNRFTSLNYAQIQHATAIDPSELKRQLQSLVNGKTKLLVKSPKSKDIGDSDTFAVNLEFTSKLKRVRVATVSVPRETETQAVETRVKVDDDRKHQIEAAIVRVMKARKVLEHNNLIAEVVNQLHSRFKPDTTFIKKRIEALIDREFLERSGENMREYRYLA